MDDDIYWVEQAMDRGLLSMGENRHGSKEWEAWERMKERARLGAAVEACESKGHAEMKQAYRCTDCGKFQDV